MNKILAFSGIFILIFITVCFTLGCANNDKTVEMVSLEPNMCPMPTGLNESDLQTARELSAEVGGIVKYIGDVSFKSKINDSLKRKYNQDKQLQMVYGLTYSACVACRVSASSPSECMSLFRPIISSYTTNIPENSLFNNYEDYANEVLWK